MYLPGGRLEVLLQKACCWPRSVHCRVMGKWWVAAHPRPDPVLYLFLATSISFMVGGWPYKGKDFLKWTSDTGGVEESSHWVCGASWYCDFPAVGCSTFSEDVALRSYGMAGRQSSPLPMWIKNSNIWRPSPEVWQFLFLFCIKLPPIAQIAEQCCLNGTAWCLCHWQAGATHSPDAVWQLPEIVPENLPPLSGEQKGA